MEHFNWIAAIAWLGIAAALILWWCVVRRNDEMPMGRNGKVRELLRKASEK